MLGRYIKTRVYLIELRLCMIALHFDCTSFVITAVKVETNCSSDSGQGGERMEWKTNVAVKVDKITCSFHPGNGGKGRNEE